MSKLIIYIRWSFFLLLLTTSAHAASLETLVSEVLEKNPDLKFYQAEIAAAKGMRNAAGRWSNPEISGSLGQKRTWNEDDELTGKGETGELSLTQMFEWPGRLALKRAIADRDIELAELGFQKLRMSIIGETRIAAYEFLAAQELEAASLEVSDHFSSLREVLGQRNPAGLTPLLETRIIEAMALTMRRKATEASSRARTALFKLNKLRGASADEKVSLSALPIEFAPLEKDLNEFLSLTKTNDFEVRKHAIELKRQGYAVGLAEKERLPNVSVGPFVSEEDAVERERVVGAAISLPLPIWDLNQGNINTAKARRSQAEIAFQSALREAEQRTIEAFNTYKSKLNEMTAWQPDSIQHFKEAAELADRHYRLGAVPVSLYVELQTQYLEALEGLHSTKKEALEAAMQLEILTGKPLSLVMDKESAK